MHHTVGSKGRRRIAHLRRGGRAFLVAAALFAVSAPVATAATPKQLTPLQRGLAFYRGKTILFISPGQAGGTFDLPVRDEARYMGEYLHATGVVENIPQANTIPGQDQTAAASPDGLTLGLLNSVNDAGLVLTKTPGLNFNPERLEYIAENAAGASAFVVPTSSPFHSFAQLKSSPSPVSMLTESSGSANTILRAWMGVLGVNARWVSGYGSLGTLVQGFVRGDGEAAYINLTNVGPLLASGEARVLAVNEVPPPGTGYRSYVVGYPTIADIFKQFPPKTARKKAAVDAVLSLNALTGDPLVTQTAVAGYKLVALRAAAKWAFHQPGFRTFLLNAGINPTYIDPVAAKDDYITALEKGPSVTCYIEGTC